MPSRERGVSRLDCLCMVGDGIDGCFFCLHDDMVVNEISLLDSSLFVLHLCCKYTKYSAEYSAAILDKQPNAANELLK